MPKDKKPLPLIEPTKLIVKQSNELVGARYALTFAESRVLAVAISREKWSESIPKQVTITAKRYAQAWGVDLRTAYQQLKLGTLELYERSLILWRDRGKDDETRFLQRRVIDDGEGKVTLVFSDYLLPLLNQLSEQFTHSRMQDLRYLQRPPAFRLFYMAMQWKSVGKFQVTLERLRHDLELSESYVAYKAMNYRILKPAIQEINETTDYLIQYKPLKKGRKVDSLEFTIIQKSQKSLDFD
ncbi:MAG: replication initiation protein [Gammaproteobacteria bacterium]|nr:replication initiation protein [Gammaproteobacteria bacterium]